MQSKLSRQISDGLTSQFDSYKTEKPREISLNIQSAPYFACAARPYWTLYVQKGGEKKPDLSKPQTSKTESAVPQYPDHFKRQISKSCRTAVFSPGSHFVDHLSTVACNEKERKIYELD